MPNYVIGKIYKIYNTEDNKIYLGSTTFHKLSTIMRDHLYNARDDKITSKLYDHMRAIGIEHFDIALIKEIVIKDKNALNTAMYREMARRKPERLLNINKLFVKRCKVNRGKGVLKGTESPNFKRGSIIRRRCMISGYPMDSIVFIWYGEFSKRRQISWSVKRYGLAAAKQMAENYRDVIYPVQ